MYDESEIERLRRENATLRARLDLFEIKVTFPPADFAAERKRLEQALSTLRALVNTTLALLHALRSCCDHPKMKNGVCPDCGEDRRD